MKTSSAWFLSIATVGAANAAPITYQVDPDHTHPSFEVDHFNGLSKWRGIFKHTRGTITVDTEVQSGTVNISIDPTSIDLAHDKLNEHVTGPEMLDVAKYPTASYEGKLIFSKGIPAAVDGSLTLHGVTKPVHLTIDSFKCIQHPMLKKQVCGADATGHFNRADFGVNYGEQYGFRQDVALRIQVEAIKTE